MLITVTFIVNIFEMSFLCCLPNANLSLSTLIMSKLLTQDKDQPVAKSSWYKNILLQEIHWTKGLSSYLGCSVTE